MLTVTALGLTTSVASENRQLSFFDSAETAAEDTRTEVLEATVDDLRDRFGRGAITLGGSLLPDLGLQEREHNEAPPVIRTSKDDNGEY